jgi:hypothetical protein
MARAGSAFSSDMALVMILTVGLAFLTQCVVPQSNIWDAARPDAAPKPRHIMSSVNRAAATPRQQAAFSLRDRRGLYAEPQPAWAAAFDNVVLVTASNWAYRDMLANWECAAASLGLQWIVIALDQRIFDHLGPERAILTSQQQISGVQSVLTDGFNVLTCNKLWAVRELLLNGADVVFSDPDNVFVKDPFRPGEELGGMMRRGFDYVYSANIHSSLLWPSDVMAMRQYSNPALSKRGWRGADRRLMLCSTGDMEEEGNTGLHYIRAAAKGTISLFETALDGCNKHPELDDQTNFWVALHAMNTSHCTKKYMEDGSVDVSVKQSHRHITVCCLDPRTYVAGGRVVRDNPSIVAYHANWISGKAPKIKKLKKEAPSPGLWFWDGTSCSARMTTKEASRLAALKATQKVRSEPFDQLSSILPYLVLCRQTHVPRPQSGIPIDLLTKFVGIGSRAFQLFLAKL